MPGLIGLRATAPLLLMASLTLLANPLQASTPPQWQDLEDAMARGAAQDRLWTNTWLGIYGASAATGVVLASTSGSSTERYDARVRTVTSTLALADTLMNPLPHRPAHRQFKALAEHDPDQALSLEQARGLAQEVALIEQRRQGWDQRLSSLVVNTAAGLVIGVGDSRPRDGFSTALLGIAVTEANIRTEPRALTQATQVQIGQTRVNLYPQFAASPGHLALSIRF